MPTKTTIEECTLLVPKDISKGQDLVFFAKLQEESEQHPSFIYLDCSELDLVQSSHIGLLWLARDICTQASTGLVLKNTNGVLLESLRVLDLSEFFGIVEPSGQLSPNSSSAKDSSSVETSYLKKFSASIADIDAVMDDFVEFLKRLKIEEEISFNLRTVFYEVATNIRCHAGLRDDELVRFSASYESNKLIQVFEDTGQPFDLTARKSDFDPYSAAHSRQTRGFGISMIKGLVSDIAYEHTDNGRNVLSLTTDCLEIP